MKKIIVNLPAAFLVQIWSFKKGKEMHTSGYFKKYSIISNLAHFEQMVEQSKKKLKIGFVSLIAILVGTFSN